MTKRAPIGHRLVVTFSVILTLSLLTTTLVVFVLVHGHRTFDDLFNNHFKRAMIAAEITRDTDALMAEVLAKLTSVSRSNIVDNFSLTGKVDAYLKNHNALMASAPAHDATLVQTNDWTIAFVSGIETLKEKVLQERELKAHRDASVEWAIRLIKEIDNTFSDATDRYRSAIALTHITAALNSNRQGLIRRNQERATRLLGELRQSATPSTLAFIGEMDVLSQQVAPLQIAYLRGHRATLAAERQTRKHALKITSTTHGYYLSLKRKAQIASESLRQSAIETSIIVVFIFGVALIVTALTILYINRRVIRRLSGLQKSMQAHVDGAQGPIPTGGNDEISDMASAFQVFVTARAEAEASLRSSRQEVEKSRDILAKLASTDVLCPIPNRRSFDAQLKTEWRRGERTKKPLAVAMIDVDFFKNYNDYYGHSQGDECLIAIAEAITETLSRGGDFPARYGGEEFVCLFPETDADGAREIGDKIRRAIADLAIPHIKSPVSDHVTISVGVAAAQPDRHTDPGNLIERADKALYQAKENGRNQVAA